jgi:hypothetical protein
MFLNDLQNRLQPTAVPTLVNVPNPPKQIAVRRPPPKRRMEATVARTSVKAKRIKQSGTVTAVCQAHGQEFVMGLFITRSVVTET